MLHDNDPIHSKFGYAAMVEKAAIRDRLIAEGHDPEASDFSLKISSAYTAAHADDPSYAETSARLSAKWRAEARERWLAAGSPEKVNLTRAEMEYLAGHFDGANDPLVAAILAKVREALGPEPAPSAVY